MKAERKSRGGGRAKAGRTSARIARVKAPPQQSFARRTKLRNDIVSRTVRGVRSWFNLRRPMLKLCAGLFLLVLIGALFASGIIGRTVNRADAAVDAMLADAGFGISEVHVTGNAHTPPETIGAALGLAPGQSIFGADLKSARARLMGLDWVADADVRRRYPDAIYVRLVEKLPFALWKAPNGLYLIERSGGAITNKNLEPFARLPLLVGPGGNNGAEIVDAVAVHRALLARVRATQRISNRRWNLILDDGVVVKLPEAGWQNELDTLEHLIVDKGILERDIGEIDLRSPTRFFFILKTGEKKAVERGKQI